MRLSMHDKNMKIYKLKHLYTYFLTNGATPQSIFERQNYLLYKP
ncbi:hypothetical protein SAMN03159284_04458 [Mucilaginibacter sp. NFR10]|nr:hypothetical protein SAMN03159284_04458 [Mucilaginibacter sp. NFR10]